MANSMAQLSTPQATVESTPDSLSGASLLASDLPPEGMSREELIQLVKTIMDYGRINDGKWIEQARQWIDSFETDYPQAGLLKVLCQHVADPQVEGYMFWPRLHTDPPREMTPAEIIDKALAYQPQPCPPQTCPPQT